MHGRANSLAQSASETQYSPKNYYNSDTKAKLAHTRKKQNQKLNLRRSFCHKDTGKRPESGTGGPFSRYTYTVVIR